MGLNILNETSNNIGNVAADPAAGAFYVSAEKFGSFFRMDISLRAARIPVTDAGAGGSYGSLKLFDFLEGSVAILASRQNFTAFAEGAALTTAAGDASFKIAVGSQAITAAADAVLATAEKDIGGQIALVNTAGTSAGTLHSVTPVALDGTSTGKDVVLNFSGSAATIDASSTIDVTGTITIIGVMMADD